MTQILKYEVQTYTICDGWVNCWLVDDELEYFDSEAEALTAIKDHIKDYREAVAVGDCDIAPSEEEFRVMCVVTA